MQYVDILYYSMQACLVFLLITGDIANISMPYVSYAMHNGMDKNL